MTGRAGRREWIGLAVIALPCLLYAMDLTVLYLAVPALTRDLQPSSTELLWITDIYGFFVAGWLITMGRLGDRIGRRRLLLIGAAAFGAASVLAAFSTSPGMLIVARALLGVAGATLAPSTLALIRNMFHDPAQRTTAIGVWATSFSVGAALGPLLGGLLLEVFWWGSVFLLAVPVMALLLVVGPRLLPEHRDPSAGRFDLTSSLLSLAAVLALVYGLKQLAVGGLAAAPALAMGLGLILGTVFVRRQLTLADPLLDVRMFRAPAFSAALAANGMGIFVIAGADLLLALYLQLVAGLSPLEAGLWTLPSAGGFIVGSTLAPALTRRYAAEVVVPGGLALAAVGLAGLTLVPATGGLPLLVAGSVVLAIGAALAFTLSTDLLVGRAPVERAGAVSATSETATELGGALGIAALGTIGAAVYRAQAGEPLGGVLVDAGAFTQGLHVAAAAAAVATALLAAATVPLLRPPGPTARGQDRRGRPGPRAAGTSPAQPAPSRC